MIINAFLFSGLALLPSVTSKAADPQITISNTQYSGAGCPQRSVSFSRSYNLNKTTNSYVITTGFESAIYPYYGPGTALKDHSKSCDITFDVSTDTGYKLRISGPKTPITAHGWTLLPDKLTELHGRLNYAFADSTNSTSTFKLVGPLNGVFTVYAQPTDGGTESKCGGGSLKMQVRNRVTTRNAKPGGELGDPFPEDRTFYLQNNLEVLEC